MATTKAEEAKADRLMQSIASLGKDDAPQILAWLRDGWRRKVFLMEDISSGRNSSVGTAVGNWLRGRHALPAHQHEISAFRSPGDIVRAMPQTMVEPVISNRQDMLLDRSKAQLESWSHTFPSGMTLTVPFTAFAAVSASIGTTWCTGAMKENRFEQYAEMTPLLIMRLPSGEMYQASFDVAESGLTGTVQMDGGSAENLSGSLERFINNGLTVKNAMDEDLTPEQYQGFMPFFQDVIPMLARYIERAYGGEWERILEAVSPDEDVDDDLEMDVSHLCQLLTDSVVGGDEPEEDEAFAPDGGQAPESDTPAARTSVLAEAVTERLGAAGIGVRANVLAEAAMTRPLSADHSANMAAIFDSSPAVVRNALRRILLDCGPAGQPEHAEAIETLHQFGSRADTAFLLEVIDGFNSSDFFTTFGEETGAISALVESMDTDRFGDLMAEAWQQSGNLRKVAFSIMSGLSDNRLVNSYSRFFDGIDMEETGDRSQAQVIDFVAMRSEMVQAGNASGLPEHIRGMPWMNDQDRDAVRLGYLIEGAERMRQTGQFGIRDVLGIMLEYSPITEGMKAFPDGMARLLTRDGTFSSADYIETVATLFDAKERSVFDDHIEWDGAYDAIASTLIAKFDDIRFPDTNTRTACIAALSAMDRKAVRLAPREQRWLFDAFAFRGVEADEMFGLDEKIKTSHTRGASIDDGKAAWEFMSANDVPSEDVDRARMASRLSSLIPHPDSAVLAEIESVRSGSASEVEVGALARRAYASGLEQFEEAKAAFSRASAHIIRSGEYQSVLGEAMEQSVKDVNAASRLLTDGMRFVQDVTHDEPEASPGGNVRHDTVSHRRESLSFR